MTNTGLGRRGAARESLQIACFCAELSDLADSRHCELSLTNPVMTGNSFYWRIRVSSAITT